MFNGSENLPGDYFTYLQQIGATDYNGTTWFDRTNYFQTVPTGALERALFMESDRMGHLLGAVTQGVLDNQRGVVQNEKRQGDNQPGGLVDYELLESAVPRRPSLSPLDDRLDGRPRRGQPRRRQATGSATNMARTMRCWCSPATSTPPRPGRWSRNISASIPRGPVNNPAQAAVPTLAAPKSIVMKDQCRDHQRVSATGRCRACSIRSWSRSTSAARSSAASPARASTRCWCATRRSRSVSAGLYAFQRVGMFTVDGDGQAGRRSGAGREAARRARRRIHRQRPDRGRGQARVGQRGRGPDPRARAGRRLRRQGGDAGRGADLCRRQRFLREEPCHLCGDHAGRRCARRCSSG